MAELVISWPQAVLGAEVEVETLHGSSDARSPARHQPGRHLTLRGKGVPRLDGGTGDHHVAVTIDVPRPRDLDADELELVEALGEKLGDGARQERTVFRRVKDLFG